MYSARRIPLWSVWLLAGWLLAAQCVGLIHEQLAQSHPVADACLSCTLNGAAGGALLALPPVITVAPACAEPIAAVVLPRAHQQPAPVRARGPPTNLVS